MSADNWARPVPLDGGSMRPFRVKKMWNGSGWTYYKRWENFTRLERNRWHDENPDAEAPPPKKIVATNIPQFRAGEPKPKRPK